MGDPPEIGLRAVVTRILPAQADVPAPRPARGTAVNERSRPEVPVLPVLASRLLVAVLPEVAQVLFDRPSADRFRSAPRRATKRARCFSGRFSSEYSHRYFEPARLGSCRRRRRARGSPACGPCQPPCQGG